MWQKVAEADSFSKLRALVADREMKKGQRMQVVMDFAVPGVAKAFDSWGAESIFNPFVPDGMDLVDVYEKGGKGIVEMEADPVWLVAAIGFIARHWLTIVIAGAVLYTAVSLITIFADIVPAISDIPWWIWGTGALLAGYVVFRSISPKGGS